MHQIIDRLECLKLVHEECALINEKFKNLKDLETNLLAKLSENQDGLSKVKYIFLDKEAYIDAGRCLQTSP